MLNKEGKNPYRIRTPVIWDEIDDIKRRLMKLESNSETYELLFEARTLEELNSLVQTIKGKMIKYGVVFVNVEKLD